MLIPWVDVYLSESVDSGSGDIAECKPLFFGDENRNKLVGVRVGVVDPGNKEARRRLS